ncbi:hypothetical protein [Fischerella sp. PCC 9605]|uniref:hypothetical protein n=1 Tax=Fischerella sp. PCC 9605 TaxID=1173024 RepID=UPI00047B2F01|nr:hypothetical protein [Fischerella sp. PCC 9605]
MGQPNDAIAPIKSMVDAYLSTQLSPENIQKHITIINNRPSIDLGWLLGVISASFSLAVSQTATGNFSWLDTINIRKNIQKTRINLKYQEKFGVFLDRVDKDLHNLKKELPSKTSDEEEFKAAVCDIIGNLKEEFEKLCEDYRCEYRK